MQPSQQHVTPCVKGVEWGLGTRGLGIVAAFWGGIVVIVFLPIVGVKIVGFGVKIALIWG